LIAPKLPPTLVIIGTVLLLACIAAELLAPGKYQRIKRTIPAPGFTHVEHVIAQGETIPQALAAKQREQMILLTKGDDRSTTESFAQMQADAVEKLGVVDAATEQPITTAAAGTKVLLPLPKTREREVVVRGTYEAGERPEAGNLVEMVMVTVGRFFTAPMKGFEAKVDIIAFILLIGGAFGIILATGAIDAGLHHAVHRLEKWNVDWLTIPLLMTLFSLAGATFGMSEEVIPFVLITIPLALRLGYDTLTGLCISFVAAGIGFAAALTNPFTIGIAQGIAGIAPFSGMGFRFVIWILATLIGIIWTMRWASRVKANPAISPTHQMDEQRRAEESTRTTELPRFGLAEATVLLITAAMIFFGAYGVTVWDWWLGEMTACFIAGAVAVAIVGRISVHKAANAFSEGASQLTGAVLVIAVSAAILEVLKGAEVLDTILYGIDSALGGISGTVGACVMFGFHTALNFFIPSGSGQAAVTMPLMAPLADLMGISRQTAVLAFQFGDGFCNMIIPTSAVTMSVLGLAKVPWEVWAKWILPLQIVFAVFGCIMLAIAVAIGWQ
jgi:uncharacterized ion transporter superfamily protein YfcC